MSNIKKKTWYARIQKMHNLYILKDVIKKSLRNGKQ